MNSAPVIVKLGGSLLGDLHAVRARLAEIAALPLAAVIVPGGGPFADTVRRMQPRLGLTDDTAHAMALLAMNQVGLALAAQGTLPIGGTHSVARLARPGRPAVWMAAPDAHAFGDLRRDWSVTSDTLAVRLGIALDAPCVIIVKAARVAATVPERLVDAAFAGVAARYGGMVALVGAGDPLSAGLPAGITRQSWKSAGAAAPCPIAHSL